MMERKCKSKASFVEWSKVWIALLLFWACTVPAIISAKSAWDRGTIRRRLPFLSDEIGRNRRRVGR